MTFDVALMCIIFMYFVSADDIILLFATANGSQCWINFATKKHITDLQLFQYVCMYSLALGGGTLYFMSVGMGDARVIMLVLIHLF